jgi:hypothetical protein
MIKFWLHSMLLSKIEQKGRFQATKQNVVLDHLHK